MLVIVAAVIVAALAHRQAPSVAYRVTFPSASSGAPPGTPFSCDLGTPVPLNTTVSDGDFDIKLLRVIYKPAVIGVPPDPGTEYLEADFALTVLPHPQGFDAPVVYIPSKQPAGYIGCGLQLAPVDTQSNNPLSGDNMAPRNVRVPGKQSIESDAAICLAVGSGATCNPHAGQTDDDYALFEIPAGDNGHIVWESDNGQSYTFEW